MRRFTLRLDEETHATLEAIAFIRRQSMQEMIEGWVEDSLGALLDRDRQLADSVRGMIDARGRDS